MVANIITSLDSAATSWMATLQQNASKKVYGSGELAFIRKIRGWETSSKVNILLEKNPLREHVSHMTTMVHCRLDNLNVGLACYKKGSFQLK